MKITDEQMSLVRRFNVLTELSKKQQSWQEAGTNTLALNEIRNTFLATLGVDNKIIRIC
jgi:hypothetical protein